jgi:hypothetical protein
MLYYAAAEIADVHLVRRAEIALAHDADWSLLDAKFREFIRNRLNQGIEPRSVRLVCTGVQSRYRLDIRC